MDLQTVIRTTQALGITSALFSSGIYFGSSLLSISPILPLPINESTHIFSDIYHTGKGTQVPLAAAAIAFNALAAYLIPSLRLEHGTAAVSAAGTMILTGGFMLPGIERLLQINKMDGSQIQGVRKQEVVDLMLTWKAQNYARAAMALVAGVLGLYAVLKTLPYQQAQELKRQ